MKILLDECLPRRLARLLAGHDVRTVQQMGWSGLSNGELLDSAESFDLFLTVDRNLVNEQQIAGRPLAVIVFCVQSNRIEDISPVVPKLLDAIPNLCIAASRGDLSVVIRVSPTCIPSPAQARIPDALLEAAVAPSGLLVIAGLTGSGKTTTAYSILDDINARLPVHICTVEDPIGIVIEPKRALIQQREIGVDAPDVLAGIAASLRQHPDVLFVPNDLKTVEEVQACITAALTGHLVLINLHASTPEAAIQTLIDVPPPEHAPIVRRNLAQVLRAASVQILLPVAGGRNAAYGVLVPDDRLRHAIINGESLFDRIQPLPPGCQTLAEDIGRMRDDGLITDATAEQALRDLQ